MILPNIKIFATTCFFFLWGTSLVTPQSKFNKNLLSEKNVTELLQTVQKNSKNLNAHFKLGQHFNQKREWQLAKKHLLKSYALTLGKKDKKKKAGILYELAQNYRAIGEIKACEDALKGIKNLVNPKEDIWDKVVLQLAEVLYLQNLFNEALAQLHSYDNNQKSLFYTQLLEAITTAIEVDKTYINAIEAESERHYKKARSLYTEIDKKFPGFKDVQQRLNEIQKLIAFNPVATSALPENTHVELAAKRKIKHTKTETSDPNKSFQPKKTTSGKKRLVNKKSNPANHSGKISKSKKVPQKELSKKRISQKPAPPKGIKENDRRLTKNIIYRDTKLNLVDNAMALAKIETSPHGIKVSIPKIAEDTIQDKSTPKYLWATTFFVAIILTGTGLTIYFNPFFRARTMTLIGRKENALVLYEGLINQKPQMLWLYPYLARLYDHFNRQDLKAIRVYKIIQHLSMHSNAEDSFAANISNKYLSHETTNVKIEILDRNNS